MAALALLLVGVVVTVAGTALFSWKAAVIVAGIACIALGVDLARPDRDVGP